MPPKKRNSCSTCDKDVGNNDKALGCSICENWYHIKCERVTIDDYEFLKKSDNSIQWYCKSCKGASLKLFKMITMMHKRQDDMDNKMDSLTQDVGNCLAQIGDNKSALNNLKDDLTDLKDTLPIIVSRRVVSVIQDKVEEDKREDNLIFFNVPESESIEVDEEFILELCKESLGVNDIQINEASRLGPKPKSNNDKARIVKVMIKNKESRSNILKNAYKLKDAKKDTHKKVGIGRDLTRSQREHNKLLRTKLAKMVKDFPNKKFSIRNDQVVEVGPGFPPRGDQGGGGRN